MAIDVTSPLLSDPPAVPARKDQPVDEDYARSLRRKLTESLEDYDLRLREVGQ
ncbi:hypothetical protein ACFV0B_11170 [Streptomyces xanthophaeus]|uniref:hypothetical protein n=1 Tax=Streptomyces xanthophaeus TaxID=67385 RepID=UPI0036B594EC